MKIARILCLLLVCLLALAPVGTVLAQQETLSLKPSDGKYNMDHFAGQDRAFYLDLKNISNNTVTNVTFTAEKPRNWTVEFDPEKIASLTSTESKTVATSIFVPADSEAGDFQVTIRAVGDQGAAVKVDIRVVVARPVIEPKLELRALYPTLSGIAGEQMVFEVEFLYTAAKLTDEPITCNLTAKAPPNWTVTMTPPYEQDKKLSAITLKPGFTFGDKIRVAIAPPFLPLPDPGEYMVTMTADSGKFKGSLDLKAIITARYNLFLVPSNERYNTNARAGKENSFSIEVGNLGTAAIDKINFSSTKPAGWTIEYKPDKVDSLAALDSKTVDVVITPPADSIAGDYQIKLSASGTQATAQEMQVRVTVQTPTVWGWVGVVIIFVVIAGLVIIFMRFSRR